VKEKKETSGGGGEGIREDASVPYNLNREGADRSKGETQPTGETGGGEIGGSSCCSKNRKVGGKIDSYY